MKSCICYSFDDITKLEDFDFDITLVDKKNISNYFDLKHFI